MREKYVFIFSSNTSIYQCKIKTIRIGRISAVLNYIQDYCIIITILIIILMITIVHYLYLTIIF